MILGGKPNKVGWLDKGSSELHEGRGNCLKYLKRGWNRKDGRGNKDFEKGWQAGSRCRCFKKVGGDWNSLTNYVIHALNILLECIERNTFFEIGEQ